METVILEIVNDYGMELLKALVLITAGLAAAIVCRLCSRYVNTEVKRTLARTGVLFVEQVFKDLHGEEKMDKFLEWVAARLQQYGIKFDADEMKALAEAWLAEFNGAFAKYIQEGVLLEGIDVDDLADEQLRDVAVQAGLSRTYVDGLNRDKLLEALDTLADENALA